MHLASLMLTSWVISSGLLTDGRQSRVVPLVPRSHLDDNSASIADYVKGVHGGKYEFSDPGVNQAGQDFATSLYASNPPPDDDDDDNLPDEIPRWAQRMGNHENLLELSGGKILKLRRSKEPAAVHIKNMERTWEPFFVKFVSVPSVELSSEPPPFQASPLSGKLAPFGGATNHYNLQKPYQDSASINVWYLGPPTGNNLTWFLVVGTEEEKWCYQLQITVGTK